jgi:hypothetical protein
MNIQELPEDAKILRCKVDEEVDVCNKDHSIGYM